MIINQPLALVRLLQLASPALPVGAFAYSQGLEWAVEDQVVRDEQSAKQWIGGVFDRALSRVDAPVLLRFIDAWSEHDWERVAFWNQTLLACRETRELRDEDAQLGNALAKLLEGLGLRFSRGDQASRTCFAMPFGLAAFEWRIPKAQAVSGYLWAWLENQVLGAIKLVPLGQLSGQRMLFELAQGIPAAVDASLSMRDDEIGGALPFFAIASSRHESQYSRLFRS